MYLIVILVLYNYYIMIIIDNLSVPDDVASIPQQV